MITIHPKCSDTFYLRLLLKNRAGALFYKYLRTIGVVVHPAFKRTCIALNFCASNKQWIDCLDKSVIISAPRAICQLFANILLHYEPSGPRALYGTFRNNMGEELLRKEEMFLTKYSDNKKQKRTWNALLTDLNSFIEKETCQILISAFPCLMNHCKT